MNEAELLHDELVNTLLPIIARTTYLVKGANVGSSALLMKLACLSLPRIRCQKCPTIHFTYSSIE